MVSLLIHSCPYERFALRDKGVSCQFAFLVKKCSTSSSDQFTGPNKHVPSLLLLALVENLLIFHIFNTCKNLLSAVSYAIH